MALVGSGTHTSTDNESRMWLGSTQCHVEDVTSDIIEEDINEILFARLAAFPRYV